ncbi:MAG: hypothetical protein KGD64_08120 [Candidatus Heimdallarchaeota archaeon]|nr:hypothetical protein [Candidatus Heimdallarchaeota archaeon]
MVKNRTFAAMVILALMCSMSIITLTQSKIEQTSTLPSLDATTRPVFAGGDDDNTTVLVARNDAVFNGSVLRADVPTYSNVTFWYTFVGGDNESAPLLFGDDGTNTPDSLSWVNPTLMTYDNESSVELGLGVKAYYNYTFNLSSSFVSFYARYGEYESPFKIPNLITTGVWLESYFVQEQYTQYEDIEMDIILHDYNISQYGLMYREVESTHSLPFENVTYSLTDEGAQRNVTAAIGNSFDAGTQLEIRSFIVHYDNITSEYRTLTENKVRLVTLVDGNPELTLESERYTNSRDVTIYWEAEAINSNISAVEVDWDDGSGIESANISIPIIIHSYASSGEYNINVTAFSFTGLGSVTDNFTVLIETIAPTGIIQLLNEDGEYIVLNETETFDIVVEKKELQFNVSGTDTGGSGVAKLVIETDEGNIIESPIDAIITIPFLEYGFHFIIFKVYDAAGNEYSFEVYIKMIEKELPTYAGVPFPFGLVTIAGLISIALIYLKKRK